MKIEKNDRLHFGPRGCHVRKSPLPAPCTRKGEAGEDACIEVQHLEMTKYEKLLFISKSHKEYKVHANYSLFFIKSKAIRPFPVTIYVNHGA